MAVRDLRPHSSAARSAGRHSGSARPAVVRVGAPANDNRLPLLRLSRVLAWIAAAIVTAILVLP